MCVCFNLLQLIILILIILLLIIIVILLLLLIIIITIIIIIECLVKLVGKGPIYFGISSLFVPWLLRT